MSKTTTPDTRARRCIHCGKAGPFRSRKALRCVKCDAIMAQEKKNYTRVYLRARSAAARKLREKHREEWETLLDREFKRAKREEAQRTAA